MPYGSCEVFLETHDQICDTITPNGTCVYELENAVKVCDIHNPNGSCNAELVTDAMACIFNIPEGSCNVELLSSTTTCSNTVPNGDCSVQLDTFTKTCQEDVLEPLTCLMTANTEESTCTGTPNYDMKYCKYTRDVEDVACSIKYEATYSAGETVYQPGSVCSGAHHTAGSGESPFAGFCIYYTTPKDWYFTFDDYGSDKFYNDLSLIIPRPAPNRTTTPFRSTNDMIMPPHSINCTPETAGVNGYEFQRKCTFITWYRPWPDASSDGATVIWNYGSSGGYEVTKTDTCN